ncbi:hypothetical protein KCU65_g4196, partial [Aureobasidium melanogenum]
MDSRSEFTTTTHGYPLSSYCVGLRKALDTVPGGNTRNAPRNHYDWIRKDGPDTPLENIFAGLRLDDIFALTLEDRYAHQTSTQPKFLTKLPPEIIYRILSFMDPEDYIGFAEVSPLALELSNNHIISEFPELSTKKYPNNDDPSKGSMSYLERNPDLRNYAAIDEFYRLSEWEREKPCMLGVLEDPDNDVDLDGTPPIPTQPQPTLFTKLPREIIYRILSFISPEDYVGFADTCSLALELSNHHVESEDLEWKARNKEQKSATVLDMCPGLRNYALAHKKFESVIRQYEAAELLSGIHPNLPLEDEEDEDLYDWLVRTRSVTS